MPIGRTTTVLVVSDDPGVRASVKLELESDHRHVFACSHEEIVRFCRAIWIHVIVALEEGATGMARLREGLAAMDIPARQILVVERDVDVLRARLAELEAAGVGESDDRGYFGTRRRR